MAADGFVQVPPNSTGGKVDCSSLSVAGATVVRQRVVIGDNAHSANFANVTNGALQVGGTLDNISATVTVAGTVTLGAGSNNIGTVQAISAPVVLAAGANNIGKINNISATVVVSGTVSLGASTANIGVLNNISATVTVAGTVSLGAGTANIGSINNISAPVVLAAGTNNIGTINNISASVTVQGHVTVDAISATATCVIGGFLDPSGNQRNLVDSANLALKVNVVAGGAGGGIVTGPHNQGVSVTAGDSPVLVGGTDGTNARMVKVDSNGNLYINNISATVTVAGNLSIGGTVGGTSATAGSSFTLIGGTDGSLARAIKTDANGNLVINNISATVTVAGNLTVGGTTGATSYTAGSSFTMIGGMDGSLARGLLMDSSGHAIISGTVALAGGSNNIGTINNISAGVVLAAGSANIGTINNISANVTVQGTVSLGAGTANIGTINNISAAVSLAAGSNNIGSINNISANVNVVLQAGTANIGSINNISAAVVVAGQVAAGASITAGNSPVLMGGRVKLSASTTAAAKDCQWTWMDKAGRMIVQLNHPSLAPSASHGPKTVTISTSASVALIAAPGSGLVAYVDSIMVTNGSATLTRADIYEASGTATPVVAGYLAASGGGFVNKFDPPWRVSANTALNARVKPNVSKCLFVIHFHVGVD